MLDTKLQSLLPGGPSGPALVRRILNDYARPHAGGYVVAVVLMAVGASTTAVLAKLVGDFVNEAYEKRDFSIILGIGLIIVAIFMIRGAATYGHSVITQRIANRITAQNQRLLYASLLRQNLDYFADRHSSEFAARLAVGATSVARAINLIVGTIGFDLISLIALVAVMAYQDPILTLIALFVMPPIMLVLGKMIRRVRAIATAQFTGGTRILETMQETLQGIRIVKAFTLEDAAAARFAANVAAVETESNKLARVASRSSPIMDTLGGIGVALALLYGGYRVILTGATPGQFVSFIVAALLSLEPAKRIVRLNIDLSAALVGVRVLFDVVDLPPSEPADDAKAPLAVSAGRIAFRDVHFAYRPGEPVLRGISFTAEPAMVTALVGHSGAGKSTVFNLLLRFYDHQRGSIAIDGQDLAMVSRRSLRAQIAYAGQEAFLFRGSIRDNIALGKAGATEEDIIAAARAAHAHDFIASFPAGYDSPVGEHGLQLSAGQRQRVVIARAFIRDAPIILLDEPTASLDSESEHLVQDAIAHLCQGRTTLVIAHRLNTVTRAHCIHVIEDGMIVESGTHDELLRRGQRYSAFYRLQLKSQEPLERPAVRSAG